MLFLSISFSQNDIAITSSGDTVLLFKDYTYQFKNKEKQKNPQLIKQIKHIGHQLGASLKNIQTATKMAEQAWRYTLPQPKSAQAMWGNYDGRTTWWYGYWKNIKTKQYSQDTPRKTRTGAYLGDGQNLSGYYRKGGSPRNPTVVEEILSKLTKRVNPF